MQATHLEPLGATVTDVAVDALDADTVGALGELLARRGVLILPGQAVDDVRFLAFLRSFGPLTFTQGETPVEGHPDLNVVSNVGRTTPPRSNFHVDTTYVREPPAYTALRAVRVPERGGETLFSDQYAAYEALPASLREELADATVTHVATGVELAPGDESEAAHPLFTRHPISGRTALYLSTPARCQAVSGLSADDARELIATLYEFSSREERVLRHGWAPGDVVIWDNRCVMHRADHLGVDGDRILHRGLVAPTALA
jgi:taurine dioxygenase